MHSYEVTTGTTVRLRQCREAARIFREGWKLDPCRHEGGVSLVQMLFMCQAVAKELMSPSGMDHMNTYLAALAANDNEAAQEAVAAVAQKMGGDFAAFFSTRDPGWTWRFEFFVDCWPIRQAGKCPPDQ